MRETRTEQLQREAAEQRVEYHEWRKKNIPGFAKAYEEWFQRILREYREREVKA